MKRSTKNIAFTAISLLFLTLASLSLSACAKTPDAQKDAGDGFAVLELFTSEGCSSCPPAEALLEELQKEYEGKPVYLLAYHVDYWDRLGWKDHFSDAAYSKLQYTYSNHFAGQVYTPQLVVNGVAEGVGSNESYVRNTLEKMQQKKSSSSLTLKAHPQSGKLQIYYEIAGNNSSDAQLKIVLVQKHAVVKVMRGENEGRTLSHAQIVRNLSLFNIGKKKTGTEKIDLPEAFNTSDWEIIGMLQSTDSCEITTANRAQINL